MSFQGRLLDDFGYPVDGEQSVLIKIFTAESGGSALWSESRTVEFNAGLFHINLGEFTALNAEVFDCPQPYIEFTIASETMPRQSITTDAYAFRSVWADSAKWTDFDTLGAYVDTSMLSEFPFGVGSGNAAFHVIGEPWFSDSLTLVAGSGVSLTQTGRDITISSSGGGAVESGWNISGSDLISDVSGNVGIGIPSPFMKLHVGGNIFSSGRIIATGTPTTSFGDTLLAYNNGTFYKYVPDSSGSTYWTKSDSVLSTKAAYGLSRGSSGNSLHGSNKYTHVNFGCTSVTGESGLNQEYCSVLSGYNNVASGKYAIVGGGKDNSCEGNYAVIGGGVGNSAEYRYAVVAGGDHNQATYLWSTVGGGYYNEANETYAVVAGGGYNHAQSYAATISGGDQNVVTGYAGTVSGGKADTVKADYGTVAGGYCNSAGEIASDISATVAGGWFNKAKSQGSAIGGGYYNVAEGVMSCIPGGSYLKVGVRSFGFRGGIGGNPSILLDLSDEPETFHIADAKFHFNPTNSNADFRIDGATDNLFLADASANHVTIGTGTLTPYLFYVNGSAAKPGTSTWTVFSDRRLKQDINPYGYGLDAVCRLKPVTYNYKKGNPLGLPTEKQYTGLIAQDLQEVIPEAVIPTDTGYLSVDTDPVIWALVNAVRELKEENRLLQQRVEDLENQ